MVSSLSEASGVKPVRMTLSDQIAQILRDKIVWGELQSEAWLAENEIARELGVSRTPVREAFQRLEADGLLVRQGTRLRVAPFDLSVAVETLIMRELLEQFAAAESVKKMTPTGIADLRRVLTSMEAYMAENPPNPKLGAQLNTEFHSVLNAQCGYPKIIETIQVLRDTYSSLRLYTSYTTEDLERVHAEHAAIVDAAEQAVAAGDHELADAVGELVRDHMRAARDAIVRNTSGA